MSQESENVEKPLVKREIVYEDSQLLKTLKDYTLEPNETIKRKIDYFYPPYGAIHQNSKFIDYDERYEKSK
jgi:hypothetical protein